MRVTNCPSRSASSCCSVASLRASTALITESSLSFLGLGAQPPTPTWGGMLATGMQYWDAWWMSVFPGLGIALAVEDLLAFSMVQPVKGIDYSLAPLRLGGLVISTLRLLSLGVIVLLSIALHRPFDHALDIKFAGNLGW